MKQKIQEGQEQLRTIANAIQEYQKSLDQIIQRVEDPAARDN